MSKSSILVFILLALASQPAVQDKFTKMIPFPFYHEGYDSKIALILATVLFVVFLLIRLVLISEGFFFEVSESGKRLCNGLFNGKPISFEYTTVGSGDCQNDPHPPLGMIGNVDQCSMGTVIQPPPY